MISGNQLQFFQEKIAEIKSAVLYNLSDTVLKIPNTIISEVLVDEVGQVWFFVNRPKQYINEFDKGFYARLHFLRKGQNFIIMVEGKANLVTDPEEINELLYLPEPMKQRARNEQLLIKLKVTHIEYAEKKVKNPNGSMDNILLAFNRFFNSRQSGYRPYKLQPHSVSF
jgi:hypothetical protein